MSATTGEKQPMSSDEQPPDLVQEPTSSDERPPDSVQQPMSGDERLRDYLRWVTIDLHDTRRRLSELEAGGREPIAIVGMSCRYPGGADSPQRLWQLLREGREAITAFPTDRGWDLRRLHDAEEPAGGTYVREAGFLHDATEFDADFFSISPREALTMDPQQRLLLEASWSAIEDGGVDPVSLRGSQTGVFVGAAALGYGVGQGQSVGLGAEESQAVSDEEVSMSAGILTSVMSGRISYTLGLEGPALTVDTACSSSLVALHLACASLRAGECSLALAGGVSVMSNPAAFVEFARQRALARDGRCKSFADAADGTSWGEGVGMLLLERVADARRAGHPVLAVVRGSAVNQDGASNGLTAPNGPAQRRVIARALASAGLSARDVDAVEGHGTGTTLGDPIEAQALLETYGRDRHDGHPLWLGSIKSNIGHAQAAGGVAGVIKMVMAIRDGVLPQTLHVDRPSEQVDWSTGEVSLLTEAIPWPQTDRPRRAGVSAFGASGTNAHVIIEQYAEPAAEEAQAPPGDAGERVAFAAAEPVAGDASERPVLGLVSANATVLAISARGEAALREQAARLGATLAAGSGAPDPGDVGLSLAGRTALPDRAVLVGGEREELLGGLEALAGGLPASGLVVGAREAAGPGRLVFVFPGQGAQWAGMARELMACSGVFARRLGECEQALAGFVDWSLREVLEGADGAPGLERVDVVQPALFAVMLALADLWRACGVHPDAVVGHSQGEIAAACVAGALSLADAARIVALRSRALAALAGRGGMVSVAAPVEEVRERLRGLDGEVALAAVNGPRSVVVSGEPQALEQLRASCERDGVRARAVPVDYAAHSAHVQAIREELLAGCAGVAPRAGEVPFYSAVSGGRLDGRELGAEYWYRNLRETVQFEQATRALLGAGHRTFVELSPHPVLLLGVSETAQAVGGVGALGSLRRGEGGAKRFLSSLGEAWIRGVEVDWRAVFDGSGARRVALPTYAFQRSRHWPRQETTRAGDLAGAGQAPVAHPLLGAAVALAGSEEWLFTGCISQARQPWLVDHVLKGMVVVPGTTFVEAALRAGAEVGCPVLQDLVHEAPLVLAGQGTLQLQVALGEPDEAGRREVAVFTRPQEAALGESSRSGEPWTRHGRGVLAPRAERSPESARVERQQELAGGAWPPPGAQEVSVESLYDYFTRYGLDYGPAFKTVRAAWVRDREAFIEVRLPREQRGHAEAFGLHPALLDACTQVNGVQMLVNDMALSRSVLPFAWRGVQLHAGGSSSVRVCASWDEEQAMALTLADELGRPVASAESFVVREVSGEQLASMRSARRDRLYRLEWVEPPDGAPAAPTAPQGWALVGERGPVVSEALTTYADLAALTEAIAGGAPTPAAVLVSLAAPTSSDGGPPQAARGVLHGALALLQRWLADERLESSRLVFVTRGAVAATPGESTVDLASASLWGFVRSAQAESPERLVLVDLDREEVSVDLLGAALASGEPQLALRGGRLLVARLARVPTEGGEAPPSASEGGEAQPSASAARWSGSVLITGGTGALGALLARHLICEHGARRLLLASRRGMQAPGAAELREELRELGAEVEIAACDVSDRDQLAGLLASVPADRPLSAVVHAAGALDDGVLASLSPERIDRVLEPKADAAWHLHELTEQLQLSAFVLFSSSTGTIGGPGQSNYGAANAFLDALADLRRGRGLPAISLAWGWWAGSEGMAAQMSAADRARVHRGGIVAMSAEEGLGLFDAALVAGEARVVPIRFDAAALRAQARAGLVAPLMRGLVGAAARHEAESVRGSLARRLASTPESERGRVVLELVRGEVAVALGHPSADAIDPRRPFSELGFDSLIAVELRNRLMLGSGVQLPATLVFDYPTCAELSDFLLARMLPGLGSPVELDTGERAVREAIASIPLARLRETGVLETLMALAGLMKPSPTTEAGDAEQLIDAMDVDGLVAMSLAPDGGRGSSGEEGGR